MNMIDTPVADRANKLFVTGFGQAETHAVTLSDGRANPHLSAGQPYSGITGKEIAALVRSPQRSVPKTSAQWFIPSSYRGADARSHAAQREHGLFWWLTLDIDQNDLPLAVVTDALGAVLGPCTKLVYSTSSATPENRKWRALVPLQEGIKGANYSDTAAAFFDLLEMTSQGVLICDRALDRTGQVIYLPNPQTDYYEHHIEQSARLALSADHPVIRRRETTRQMRAEAEQEAQQARQHRTAFGARPADGASPIEAFNAAHSVSDLLLRYGYARAGQSNDWRSPMQSSGSFATRCMGDYWVSLSGSDAAAEIGAATRNGNRHGDAFDLFCHFEHAGNRSAAIRTYAEEAGLNQRSTVVLPGLAASEGSTSVSVECDPQATPQASFGGPQVVRNARGRPVWCAQTACAILEADISWQGVLAYDEFAGLTMLLSPVPGTTVPRSSFVPRAICEADITAAVRWFNRNGFPDATRNTTADAVFAVAAATIISPVRHYLEGLRWDGVSRIGNWLEDYCQAETSAFNCKVGRAWLIAAVARALQPGCKVDNVLVLEGRQGGGKSSALRALAGEAWFFDGLRDMHGKDASQALRAKWIIELPELSALRRSENEAVKAFLSRTEERYRPPYGRTEVVEPRRCVFAGTTNRSDYLSDDTGGRRFWPVAVGRVDVAAITRDRDQLWAEAVEAFRAGEQWWLDHADEVVAAEATSQRTAEDPWSGDVLALVGSLSEVSTRDVFQLLDIPLDRRGKADAMRIAGILARAGWQRSGKFSSGPNRDTARYIPPARSV